MPSTSNFTVPQITQLVTKATEDRTELDKVVIQKLHEVGQAEVALENVRKEIELHQKLETTRREMEAELGRVEDEMEKLKDEIKVLEARKQDKRATYEEKLRNFREVNTHLLCITRTNLPFRS